MTTPTEQADLNLIMARDVMGWKEVTRPLDVKAQTFWQHPTRGIETQHDDNHMELVHFWPATRPADVMMVLEKCAEQNAIALGRIGAGWYVSQFNGKRLSTVAPTLPLAICRFAKELFKSNG